MRASGRLCTAGLGLLLSQAVCGPALPTASGSHDTCPTSDVRCVEAVSLRTVGGERVLPIADVTSKLVLDACAFEAARDLHCKSGEIQVALVSLGKKGAWSKYFTHEDSLPTSYDEDYGTIASELFRAEGCGASVLYKSIDRMRTAKRVLAHASRWLAELHFIPLSTDDTSDRLTELSTPLPDGETEDAPVRAIRIDVLRRTKAFVDQAATDLACPRSDVTIATQAVGRGLEEIPFAEGCGRRATYMQRRHMHADLRLVSVVPIHENPTVP